MSAPSFDVAVVGASLAGSAAATLLARAGLTVALVERDPDPLAYKRVCTHYIQASAVPAIERLGLAGAIERAGGVRNGIDLWTRFGWVRPPEDRAGAPRGFSVRRQVLDPMLRRRAAETPGVEAMLGRRAVALLRAGDRVAGVEVAGRGGTTERVSARLTVAADGRDSPVARLAGLPARVRPNARFAYFAYYRDAPLLTGRRAQMWLLDPDVAYAFPNDAGLTVLACFPTHARLPAFRADPERALRALFARLPEAPSLAAATRVSPLLGRLAMPNRARPPAAGGLALVGDAALTSDPLWGVGCGWAMQTAAMLSDAAAPALLDGSGIDRALRAYALRHRLGPGAHHVFMCDYSSGRPFSPIERVAYSAGARDPLVARHIEAYGERRIAPWRFVSPGAVARAARAWAGGADRERR